MPNMLVSYLDLKGRLRSLALLLLALVGLLTHDTTTPSSARLLALLQVAVLDGRDELGQLALVLRTDLGDGENGSSLNVKLESL